MIQRPKRGETEEELLKFQEEFLASKSENPAASVKKADKRKQEAQQPKDVVQLHDLPKQVPLEAVPVKKSRFRKEREEKAQRTEETSAPFDPEEHLDNHDRHMSHALAQIIERDTRNAAVFLPRASTQPFPSALHRGNTVTESTLAGKKQSLFAQHISVSGRKEFGVVLEQEVQRAGEIPEDNEQHENIGNPTSSRIIQGQGLSATMGKDEARKIHEENLEKLSSMSEEDILAERKKLLEMMDPKLVEFLSSKRKEKAATDVMDTEDSSSMATSEKKKKVKFKTAKDSRSLPVEVDSKWVNMNKVEYDKLEWMKDLPPPKSGSAKNGLAARFDFSGNLLAVDADVPVNQGLHHHGDEPERAGYTLEEMFQLARSSNLQQRSLALQTLARVIKRAKQGAYKDLLQSPILPSIVDSGVIFLFRWALDDSADNVLTAAVAAMHALVCNHADQDALDVCFSWFQGHIVPGQCPVSMETERTDGEEFVEETDADVAMRDIILGLVSRMLFLQRLKHILEIRKPQAMTVVQILEMLTKVAQHSPGLAYEVLHCPGLLDFIFKEFLPLAWEPQGPDSQMSCVYGYPLSSALRLVTALCQTGRNMAAHLISKYKLDSRILRYIAVEPCDLQLPQAESEQLHIQSLRVWRVCLSYGLSTQAYIDLYSTLVSRIQEVQRDMQTNTDLLRKAAMFGCCEAMVSVAGTAKPGHGFNKSQDGRTMELEGTTEVVSPEVNWGHVAGLQQPITSCLRCSFENIGSSYQFQKWDLHVAASCTNFLATFYRQLERQASYSAVDCLSEIEELCDNVLLPCWQSLGFKTVLRNVSQHSNLLLEEIFSNEEKVASLIELQSSYSEKDFIMPVLRSHSPYGFVPALLRLVYVLCRLHKGIIAKMVPVITQDKDLKSYVKKISLSRCSLQDNYFTRYENYLAYYYLKLVSLQSTEDMSTLHQCSLHLLARLQNGDEHLTHDLLSTVIFSPDFIPEGKDDDLACASLTDLQLSDPVRVQSATSEDVTVAKLQLLKDVHVKLASIRATYMTALSGNERAVTASRNRFLSNISATESLMTNMPGESILPIDWMFLPLIDLYSKAAIPGSSLQDSVPSHLVTMASNVLHWTYMLECWRPHVLSSVSVTLKISRVMCTFMAGNDLFLDRSVSIYLAALLREYSKITVLDRLDFSKEIPGLSSFYDFFSELVQQYESVSFGDSLFSGYVLLPLQRKHGVQMRRLLWGEKAGVLRIFRVPLKEISIPLERFLEPDESDLPLLKLYFRCLLSQTVRLTWSPIMYLTAVHHINRFLYYQGNDGHQEARNQMWKQLVSSKQEEVRQHILFYKSTDTGKDDGMQLYSALPSQRQSLLTSFTSGQS